MKIATETTVNLKEFETYPILDHVKTWKYWKYVCHAVFILAAFLCFLPQILGYSMLLDVYPDQLEDLPANAYLHTALIVSVAVTFVNLLEQIMDSLIQYFPIFRKLEGHTNAITYFEFPKVLLLIILVKDILLLQYILPNEQFDYMPGVLLGSDILFTWSYFFNLTRLGNPVWTLSKAFTISSIFALCNIAYAWTMMSEDAANNENIYIAIQVFVAVAFFLLFWIVGQWIHYTWTIDYKSTDILKYMKVIQTSVFFVFFIFYLLMCWGTAYPVSTSPDWLLICGRDYMICMVYMMSMCTVLVSIISGRVSKFGSILFSNKLLSVRKMFMRYLSHEMRTPLNTAVMGINLLIKKFENTLNLPKDSTFYDIANDIKSSCTVAVDILSDMLLYDKIESGHLALELKVLSPWSLIKKTVCPFFAQAQQLEVLLSLKFMVPSFECFVNVDKHKLSQVIRNLVSNGLKFCTKPGGYINVEVDVISHNTYQAIIDDINKNDKNQKLVADTSIITDYNAMQYLRLSVTDDGAGISEENQSKLFKSIIQFNAGELQNGQGTGLGLYISKGLINAHKGHIFVKSQGEGYGSTFTFLIPILIDEVMKSVSQKKNFTLSSKSFLSSGKIDNISNKKSESDEFALDQIYTFSSADVMNDFVLSDSLIQANGVTVEINSISHTNVATVVNSLNVANDKNNNESEFKTDDDNCNTRYPILEVPPPVVVESPLRVINVLVVDDSGICRLMIKRTIDELKIQGCRIHIDEATDGKNAVKMMKKIMNIDDDDDSPVSSLTTKKDKPTNANIVIAKALYDLILIDYQMPNMDGPTAISHIRSLGYKGQIVGLTGNVLASEVEKMRASGADKVLTKPVKEEQFENVFLAL